jgi:hypothetical protein
MNVYVERFNGGEEKMVEEWRIVSVQLVKYLTMY